MVFKQCNELNQKMKSLQWKIRRRRIQKKLNSLQKVVKNYHKKKYST